MAHPSKMTRAEKFNCRVVPGAPNECWAWRGQAAPNGYGMMTEYDPAIRRGRTIYAHRVSYELHHGPIPEGLVVRHKCDNPSCVNPAHLEIGTHSDNLCDAFDRGRRGEQWRAVR